MVTVQGRIREDVKIENIDISPIKIGAWVHIDQGDGKLCSGLICNHETLEYCYIHEQELEKGAKVELNGIMIRRDDNDYMIMDEGVGLKIKN